MPTIRYQISRRERHQIAQEVKRDMLRRTKRQGRVPKFWWSRSRLAAHVATLANPFDLPTA